MTFVNTNVWKCIGVQCTYSTVHAECFNVQPEAYRTAETTANPYRLNVSRFDLDNTGGLSSFLVTWHNRPHKHLQIRGLSSPQHIFSHSRSCTRSGAHCNIGPHQMRFVLYLNVHTHPRPFPRKRMINPSSVPLTMNHGRITLLYP